MSHFGGSLFQPRFTLPQDIAPIEDEEGREGYQIRQPILPFPGPLERGEIDVIEGGAIESRITTGGGTAALGEAADAGTEFATGFPTPSFEGGDGGGFWFRAIAGLIVVGIILWLLRPILEIGANVSEVAS